MTQTEIEELTPVVKAIESKVQEVFPEIKCALWHTGKPEEDFFKILIYSTVKGKEFSMTFASSYSMMQIMKEHVKDEVESIARHIIEDITEYKRNNK